MKIGEFRRTWRPSRSYRLRDPYPLSLSRARGKLAQQNGKSLCALLHAAFLLHSLEVPMRCNLPRIHEGGGNLGFSNMRVAPALLAIAVLITAPLSAQSTLQQPIPKRKIPRLCRGGSNSLTFPKVCPGFLFLNVGLRRK